MKGGEGAGRHTDHVLFHRRRPDYPRRHTPCGVVQHQVLDAHEGYRCECLELCHECRAGAWQEKLEEMLEEMLEEEEHQDQCQHPTPAPMSSCAHAQRRKKRMAGQAKVEGRPSSYAMHPPRIAVRAQGTCSTCLESCLWRQATKRQ